MDLRRISYLNSLQTFFITNVKQQSQNEIYYYVLIHQTHYNLKINKLEMKGLTQLKDKGNQYFKQKLFPQALSMFDKVIKEIQNIQTKDYLDPSTEISKLYVNVLNNASLASINMKTQQSYKRSRQYASKALSIDNKNVKALYRRGTATKQLAQAIQIQKGELVQGLLQLYESAKQDFVQLNVIDRNNDLAKEKLSQTIKDIYRITTKRGEQVKLTRQKQQPVSSSKKPTATYQYPKVQRRQNDMNKIMKQYKVQQVTQMVQQKVKHQYLTGPLPINKSQLQKAVRTIEKFDNSFLQFVQRMDLPYLEKINPSFDLLSQLVNIILKQGNQNKQKSANFLKAAKAHKSFDLLWKSYVGSQKKHFRSKWAQYGLPEEQLATLK